VIGLMVVLVQPGSDAIDIQLSGKGQSRSTSCGGRQRSMGRRQRCGGGDSQSGAAGPRSHSSGRLRKTHVPSSVVQRPPEEVELRSKTSEEHKFEEVEIKQPEEISIETGSNEFEEQENEQGLKIVYGMINEWVDIVAVDILEAEASQNPHYQEPSGFTECYCGDADWDTVSMGSLEDWDCGQVIEFVQPEPERWETCTMLADTSGPDSTKEAMWIPSVCPSPLESPVASPMPSPSSRSSTPSRSVRHRRRIIGAVVRPTSPAFASPAWSGALQCQSQVGLEVNAEGVPAQPRVLQMSPLRPSSAMKRSVSASALALDLGMDKSTVSAPAGQIAICWRESWQPELSPTAGCERKCVKSKSLGALHSTSSKHGLGLALPMLSAKQGLLPALSDAPTSKPDLIAWSVNMTKARKGGLRLAF